MIALKVIGLCGGSGSGKGTVAAIFVEHGVPTIDADKIYHELTSNMSDCLLELSRHFGAAIIENGRLNRVALAKIVFEDGGVAELAALNEITHKYVVKRICELISEYRGLGERAVVIDAPLLFEAGLNDKCDIIISVIADIDTRISRIIDRDGITEEHALRRVSSQKSDEWLIERSDYVINNNGDISELRAVVADIVEEIL